MSVAWLFRVRAHRSSACRASLRRNIRARCWRLEEAADAISLDLKRLCWDGPASDLDLTANTQPALLTASLAAFRAAEEAGGELAEPVAVLGHSLGEFSALVAGRALGSSTRCWCSCAAGVN